jgi:hypothetical protein
MGALRGCGLGWAGPPRRRCSAPSRGPVAERSCRASSGAHRDPTGACFGAFRAERGLAIVGLADHRQPRVDRQRCPKTRPEEHLGIDDQDRRGLRCGHRSTPAARYPTLPRARWRHHTPAEQSCSPRAAAVVPSGPSQWRIKRGRSRLKGARSRCGCRRLIRGGGCGTDGRTSSISADHTRSHPRRLACALRRARTGRLALAQRARGAPH